jgi:hypothetical protein
MSTSAKIEAQLKAEVVDLLGKAEAADQADVPDGMSIPGELARRERRLAEIARAKAVIEARAKERHAREQAEYDAKITAREVRTAATGKKSGGRAPRPPVEGPVPTDQVNLTDEESRMMPVPRSDTLGVRKPNAKVAGGGFEQCYNAQAVGGGGQSSRDRGRCGAGAERQAAARTDAGQDRRAP